MNEKVIIQLTNAPELFAIIDPADEALVSQFTWYLKRGASGSKYAYLSARAGAERPRRTSLHRFIMGAGPGEVIDHVNGDGLDCRRGNMRFASARQNMQNMRSLNQRRGGFKGVTWSKRDGYWVVHIRAGQPRPGKRSNRLTLGQYANAVEAAKAYDCAAIHYFGEFAALNFPRENYTSQIVQAAIEAIGERVEMSPNQRTGKFRGVVAVGGKWLARLRCGVLVGAKRRVVTLGTFSEPEAAARAHDVAAFEHFGALAKLNFPLGRM